MNLLTAPRRGATMSVSLTRTQPLPQAAMTDYVELAKPRIATMALVTVGAGFLLGAAPNLGVVALLHTLIGAGVVAAGGGALNHWLERRADALMRRTSNRPIPAGRVLPGAVFAYGLTLSIMGVLYLWVALPSPLAALTAALTCILYVGVYTPLKRITIWNTVIGAIPGALPPVIGWTAATGELTAPGWALFAILFVWQLPHFFSIAWMHREDYARGGMRMLPVIDHDDGRYTGIATVGTCLLLVPVTALPYFLNAAGLVYLIGSLPLAFWFLARSFRFAAKPDVILARSVLRGSLVYLMGVMTLFVADGVLPRYFAG